MLRLFGDKTTSKIVELNVWHRVEAHKNFGVVFIKKKEFGCCKQEYNSWGLLSWPYPFLGTT
jgi:hypothetical protein